MHRSSEPKPATLIRLILSLGKQSNKGMKFLTLLGLGGIIIHQYHLPYINSILLMELMGLYLFYYFGRKIVKYYHRNKEMKKRFRDYSKPYISQSSRKPLRQKQRDFQIQTSSIFNY